MFTYTKLTRPNSVIRKKKLRKPICKLERKNIFVEGWDKLRLATTVKQMR